MRAVVLAALCLTGCAAADFEAADTALAGMAGGRPVLSEMHRQREARDATYKWLVRCGVSPDGARAAIDNPAIMQAVLANRRCG